MSFHESLGIALCSPLVSIAIVFWYLGKPRTWPVLNCWSIIVYLSFAAFIALAFLASWTQIKLLSLLKQSGPWDKTLSAPVNAVVMRLSYRGAHFTFAGSCVLAVAFMVHRLKVRRPAA